MFLAENDRKLSEKEWEKITKVHRQHYWRYIADFIAPEIVAHFIATGYYKHSIYQESFDVHVRCSLYIINYKFENTKKIKSKIKEILKTKYFLNVIQEEPVLVVQEL